VTRLFAIIALFGALLLVGCSPSAPPAAPPSGPARRIVSLSPNITETLFALGLGDRVVGVTNYCSYPPEVTKLPRVGGQLDANPEAIAALHPDLVVLFDYQDKIGQQVAAIGIPTLLVSGKSLDNVLSLIDRLGEACSVPAAAQKLRADIDRRIAAVRQRTAGLPPVKVLISVDRTIGAGIGTIYVAGDDSYFSTLIGYAGGQNAAGGTGIAYPTIPAENIAELNPDVIVDLCVQAVDRDISQETLLADWDTLPSVAAVKSGRILILTESYATVPGPRTVDFLEQLAAFLHPRSEAKP